MKHFRKLMGVAAIIPFALGLNMQTGQNFLRFSVPESGAAYLGLILELLAFGLVMASKSNPFRMAIGVIFLIQAPLVVAWGVIVGMFSGFGDGASRGADLGDILPWFINGLVYASLGISTIVSVTRAMRKAKRLAAGAPR